VLESPEYQTQLVEGLFYLVRVSEVPDTEIFKICLEYWNTFTHDLYDSDIKFRVKGEGGVGGAVRGGGGGLNLGNSGGVARKNAYRYVLSGGEWFVDVVVVVIIPEQSSNLPIPPFPQSET